MSALLEQIIAHGNRGEGAKFWTRDNWITCADGTRISVIAGWGAYCSPSGDGDYPGPYTRVEAWPQVPTPGAWHAFNTSAEETCLATLSLAEECTCTGPSSNVPVDLVREFIALHGGAS